MRPALTTWLADHAPSALKRPPFTTLFDAQLWMWTLLTAPSTFRRMMAAHQLLGQQPGVRLGTHFYGGVSYLRGKRELAHLHGDGMLDAHVGKARALALLDVPGIEAHHAEGGPGWVTIDLRRAGSARAVEELLMG